MEVLTIGTSVGNVLDFNGWQSERFIAARQERRQHRQLHPTGIRYVCCMDPRAHPIKILSELPFGMGRSYQNIGGRLDLFRQPEALKSWKETWQCLKERDRPMLVIIADHYSGSNNDELGCRGHDFDIAKARKASQKMKSQFDTIFGSDPDVVTICISIDTDTDAITFHGNGGRTLDIASQYRTIPLNERSLRMLYPLMPEWIFQDLLDLAKRNEHHFQSVKRRQRHLAETVHSESILFIGQSPEACCDNNALVVGPFDPNLPSVIAKAGTMLHDNVKKYGICENGRIVLVAAAPYTPGDHKHPEVTETRKKIAKCLAKYLAEQATQAIKNGVPDLVRYIDPLNVIVSMETMLAEPFN